MINKKLNSTYKEKNELYISVKNYIHEKTNIDFDSIEVFTASRIQNESLELWKNFSIVFQDLPTNKIFCLENDKLIEKDV